MRRSLLPFWAAGLLVVLALKQFYSRAGADDLAWALAPTSRLVELLTGISFEREPGVGWVSHAHRMILAPACAGLNFMIIAFAMVFFSFAHRFSGAAGRALWLGGSLGLAYLTAIGTNAARIIAAIRLRESAALDGFLTPDRVHRAEGTAICCLSLLLVYLAIERLFRRREPPRGAGRRALSPMVPAGWYLAVTLGLPILDRAYRHEPARFAEHAIWVVSITLALALAAAALAPGLRAAGRVVKHLIRGGTIRAGSRRGSLLTGGP